MEIGHQLSRMRIDKTRLQWWIVRAIGILVVLGFNGCTSPASPTIPGNERSPIPAARSQTPFSTETIPTSDSTTTTPRPTANLVTQAPTLTINPGHGTDQECKSKLVQITSSPIYDFHWSKDGKTIYFKTDTMGGPWQGYRISNNEYIASPGFTPTTPESVAQKLNITDWWDLSLSPGEDQIIYTRKGEAAVEPTKGPTEDAASDIFYLDVFVMKDGSDKPIYLGQLDGQIERIIWFPDETKALVIGTFHPHGLYRVASAPMWIVDLSDNSMTPLYIGDLVTDLTGVDGISPDGQWVIYHFLGGATSAKSIRMRNIVKGDDQVLPLTPYIRILQALPDGRHMVILNITEPQNPDVISLVDPEVIALFDMKTYNVIPLSQHEITVAYFISEPAKLSPDMSMLAYADEGSNRLYLLTLCWPDLSAGR
jgi:hypothetical protein